jgi:hypothetical protein
MLFILCLLVDPRRAATSPEVTLLTNVVSRQGKAAVKSVRAATCGVVSPALARLDEHPWRGALGIRLHGLPDPLQGLRVLKIVSSVSHPVRDEDDEGTGTAQGDERKEAVHGRWSIDDSSTTMTIPSHAHLAAPSRVACQANMTAGKRSGWDPVSSRRPIRRGRRPAIEKRRSMALIVAGADHETITRH